MKLRRQHSTATASVGSFRLMHAPENKHRSFAGPFNIFTLLNNIATIFFIIYTIDERSYEAEENRPKILQMSCTFVYSPIN